MTDFTSGAIIYAPLETLIAEALRLDIEAKLPTPTNFELLQLRALCRIADEMEN